MELKEAHIKVRGRVQGVFFRAFVRDNARDIGLSGKVWNADEDSVEMIVQGPEKGIMELKKRCSEGPLAARVNGIDMTWATVDGLYAGFEIARDRHGDA
ncbi:MAG: acylphosphatase [Candidatus Nanoarchaeia archaeon]